MVTVNTEVVWVDGGRVSGLGEVIPKVGLGLVGAMEGETWGADEFVGVMLSALAAELVFVEVLVVVDDVADGVWKGILVDMGTWEGFLVDVLGLLRFLSLRWV